jgi:Gluconate 2-dehydrogenase subunit 3
MPHIAGFGRDGLPRRAVITGIPAAVAAAAVLGSAGCTSTAASSGGSGQSLRFFSGHQAAVVEAATARIAPGPADDPAEAGHPGAREAGVTGYIDAMLGALAALGTPGGAGAGASISAGAGAGGARVPAVFAGGPWSNRHASGPDRMASFIALDPVSRIAWRKRLAGWQRQYTGGIATLDRLAGGDFTKASPAEQDKVLAQSAVSEFLSLLFEHTVEGMYSNPEYGGNRGLAGWKDIGYPGDSQPLGYTSAEVERSDGRDPVGDAGIVADVLKLLGAL